MHCPSCRHPLESLIIEQRVTGVWQCLKCRGAWLFAPQLVPTQALRHTGPAGLLGAGMGGAAPGLEPGSAWASPAGLRETRPSPWQPLSTSGGSMGMPARPQPVSTPRASAHARTGQGVGPGPSPEDWDLCSWCGRSGPGVGNNCRHCNIERLNCPVCRGMLVGARRMGVLVDVCQRCQGLWFEKGRLEALLEALRTGVPAGEKPASTGEPVSLLQQLASFLEDTEPSVYSERSREEVGLWDAFASSMRFGARGSRKVVYDFLTLLGDLTGPGGSRR